MMQNETSAAPAIARVEEFPTTTRYHVEGARVIEMDGKRYAADFVDVDKLNRNYAHRGPRIGVHLQRLTKSNAAYRDGQSEWVWSFDGVHDESIAELVELVGEPQALAHTGPATELQAADRIVKVDSLTAQEAVGVSSLLVEQVAQDSDPGWLLVTVWHGGEMVEEPIHETATVTYLRGA